MTDRARQILNERNVFLNKYFNLILSILLLVILIFSYFIVLNPKLKSAQLVIKDNISNQKLLYNQQKRKLDTLESIINIYSQIPVSDLNRFNSVLPYKYKEEQLFGEFEELVSKNGWLLDAVAISFPDELKEGVSKKGTSGTVFGSANPQVVPMDVDLVITGIDYLGLKKFLSILEKNIRLFDVELISFSGNSQAQIKLRTYYYQDKNTYEE